MTNKVRVLIVDDSAEVRRMLSDMISLEPDLELAGAHDNGKLALERLATSRPDVVVLDMPQLDGVATVAALRRAAPQLPVIVFSALTEADAAVTIDALTHGAADFVTKPSSLDSKACVAAVREQLLAKIRALGRPGRANKVVADGRQRAEARTLASTSADSPSSTEAQKVELICVAVSTGGPTALEALLAALPAELPVPMVIVQHMPPTFTRHLAERLASRCRLRVQEAQCGETLVPGTALVAPGDFHVVVTRRGGRLLLTTNQDPAENSCRPAADVLLRSAAATCGASTLVVVLTGMGQDGLAGCGEIHEAGGQILVQDEGSSVVWGMPGAIARAGLAEKILPLHKIAGEILGRVQGQ